MQNAFSKQVIKLFPTTCWRLPQVSKKPAKMRTIRCEYAQGLSFLLIAQVARNKKAAILDL